MSLEYIGTSALLSQKPGYEHILLCTPCHDVVPQQNPMTPGPVTTVTEGWITASISLKKRKSKYKVVFICRGEAGHGRQQQKDFTEILTQSGSLINENIDYILLRDGRMYFRLASNPLCSCMGSSWLHLPSAMITGECYHDHLCSASNVRFQAC